MEGETNYTIAIVQEDEIAISILQSLLRKSGYEGKIDKFEEIQTAINYWEQNSLPQMVITDYFLNEKEDFALLEYLKLNGKGMKKLVVVLAVFILTKSSATCKYYGVDYCYDLPIKQEDVKQIIEFYKIAC